MRVELNGKAEKELATIRKSNPETGKRILFFIKNILPDATNPFALNNARKLENHKNRWRWRMADYRIIGDYDKDRIIIKVIRIAHRQEAYKDF